MPSQSLTAWLNRLEALHPKEIELGLARVGEVAARNSLLTAQCPVVTVAGTNGKGSTTAVLERLVLGAGMNVGLYTSPHLLRYNERVRVNGKPVSDAQLVAAFESIDAARGDISLTYFEFGTLAALEIFSREPLDLMILEVGLGGRLDAVNILDPDIAVITSIAIDHEAWLGNNRNSIGREKAGILREGIPAVIADPLPPRSVTERLEELHCRPVYVADVVLPDLPSGPLRQENVAAGVAVARLLDVRQDDSTLVELLQSVQLPGRLQRLSLEQRDVVLDVAHNPAAVESMCDWLETNITGPRIALFAALSDKNIHAMIRPCLGRFDDWYVAGLPGVARALEVNELAAQVADAGVPEPVAFPTLDVAWQYFLQEGKGRTLVVFGSFITVAEFLRFIEDERSRV
jgi:dihydrofolate synthase/folylpolyglutamate synthase